MWTGKELMRHLDALGVRRDGTLFVHASVRSVGKVQGELDGLVEMLAEYMNPGLLVMPALSYAEINAAQPVFHVLETPSCVGALPEKFRMRNGVQRSWHPTHSVCALGSGAPEFLAGHERFETPCAKDSPWGRLVGRTAQILFLGTGLACNTLLHGVEEWAGVPGMFTPDRQALVVITPDGRRIAVPSRRHQGHRSNHYAKLEPVFLKSGAAHIGRVGDARVHLAEVTRMVEVVEALLQNDIDLFGHDRVPDWPVGG